MTSHEAFSMIAIVMLWIQTTCHAKSTLTAHFHRACQRTTFAARVYQLRFCCVGIVLHVWFLLSSCVLLAALTPYCLHSGAICIPTFLPLTVLFLIAVSRSPEASVFHWPPPLPSADQLWAPLAPVVLMGWVALHALIYLMPIGKVDGTLNELLKSSLMNCYDWRYYVMYHE